MSMTPRNLATRLAGKTHVIKLNERSGAYLQVLLTQFTLTKRGLSWHVDVALDDDMWSIVDRAGKQELREALEENGDGHRAILKAELDHFAANERNLS